MTGQVDANPRRSDVRQDPIRLFIHLHSIESNRSYVALRFSADDVDMVESKSRASFAQATLDPLA
jgi:hypothetical protein